MQLTTTTTTTICRYYTPSDRIARNYSATAQGLTMKALALARSGKGPAVQRSSDKRTGGRPRSSAGGGGKLGSSASTSALGQTVTMKLAPGGGSTSTLRSLGASASVPALGNTMSASTTSFPSAVRTLPVSPARPRPGTATNGGYGWAPRPENDSDEDIPVLKVCNHTLYLAEPPKPPSHQHTALLTRTHPHPRAGRH